MIKEIVQQENRTNHPHPLSGLLRELTHDFTTLVGLEIQLFKTETWEKVSRTTQSINRIGMGGLIAYAGLVTLIITVVLGYATFLDLWLAAFLVGLFFMVLGAMLVQVGRNKL